MSSSSSTKNLINNKKVDTFSNARSAPVASGLTKLNKSSRDLHSNHNPTSTLVLNPSFVKNSFINISNSTVANEAPNIRYSSYSANLNSLLLASTLQSLQSQSKFTLANTLPSSTLPSTSASGISTGGALKGHSSLSSLQAVAGPLLIQSKPDSGSVETTPGGGSSAESSNATSPQPKDALTISNQRNTNLFALNTSNSRSNSDRLDKDYFDNALGDISSQLSILPTANHQSFPFAGSMSSTDDIPYLGNLSSVLPPTILNNPFSTINMQTSTARLASGVSISSAKPIQANPIFIPTNGALFTSITRPIAASSSVSTLSTSATSPALFGTSNKRKRPSSNHSKLSAKQQAAMSVKPTITVNVNSPKNTSSIHSMKVARSDVNLKPINRANKNTKTSSNKQITFIPDKTLHSKTPAVDIFINSSNSGDKSISSTNQRFHNRFQLASDVPNVQVISIPPISLNENTSVSMASKSFQADETIALTSDVNSNENALPTNVACSVSISSNENLANVTVSTVHSKTAFTSISVQANTDSSKKVKLVSKLDLRERKLLEKRNPTESADDTESIIIPNEARLAMTDHDDEMPNDDLDSDYSDFENIEDYEHWLTYKRILTKGPPLKPVNDPSKLQFLHQVGLISNSEQSEIEFNEMVEKQKLLDDTELKLSGEHQKLIQLGKRKSQTSCSAEFLQPTEHTPTELIRKCNRIELNDKQRFFGVLDLKLEQDSNRIVHKEKLWDGVLEEKRRRKEFDLCFTKIMDNLSLNTKKTWIDQLKRSRAIEKSSSKLNTIGNAKRSLMIKNLKPTAFEKSSKSNSFAVNQVKIDVNSQLPISSNQLSNAIKSKDLNKSFESIQTNKPNDFKSITWSGLADFQTTFQKHFLDQEKQRLNLLVRMNSLKEILAEKQKHTEVLVKKIETLVHKKKQIKEEEMLCLHHYNKLSQMLIDMK